MIVFYWLGFWPGSYFLLTRVLFFCVVAFIVSVEKLVFGLVNALQPKILTTPIWVFYLVHWGRPHTIGNFGVLIEKLLERTYYRIWALVEWFGEGSRKWRFVLDWVLSRHGAFYDQPSFFKLRWDSHNIQLTVFSV